MTVSDGWPTLSVANMGGGGFSRSMISRRAADTARMSCGLWKIVLARGLLSLRMLVHVESDVVLDVKFPKSFVFLQREAEQIPKCESILVVCVDEEVGVDDAGGRILDDCVRGGVVHARPV